MQQAPSNVALAAGCLEVNSTDDATSLRRDATAAALLSLVVALPHSVSSSSTRATPSESMSGPNTQQSHSSSQNRAGSKSSSRATNHNRLNGIKSLHNLPADSCRERILCAARAVSDVLHLQYILALSRSAVAEAIGVTRATWSTIAVFSTTPSNPNQRRMREWVAQKLAENSSLKLPPLGHDGIPVPPFACADRGYWPHLNELIQLLDDLKASFLCCPDRSAAVESLMTLAGISRNSVINWFSCTFPGRSHWSMLQQWCANCKSGGSLHSFSALEQCPISVSLPNLQQLLAFNISQSAMQSSLKRAMPDSEVAIPPFKRPGTPDGGREHSAGTPQTMAKPDARKFALPSPSLKAVSQSSQTFIHLVQCDFNSMAQAIADLQRATLASLISLRQNLGMQEQYNALTHASHLVHQL